MGPAPKINSATYINRSVKTLVNKGVIALIFIFIAVPLITGLLSRENSEVSAAEVGSAWAISNAASYLYGLTSDSSGNVYITGNFFGTVDFDPGAGTSNLTASSTDAFIAKYDSTGALVWAKSLAGNDFSSGYSMVVDGSGNVYTLGYFRGTADFDPGAGTSNLTTLGSMDIFISKLDSSGNFVFIKRAGGTSNDLPGDIFRDSSGNLYATGYFAGTADFDPGAGTSNLTSAGGDDVYVLKLDSAGDYVFVKQLGGASGNYSVSIEVDSSGNIYTAGSFSGTADFDPGAGTSNLTSAGSYDLFVSKLDSSGNFSFAKQMGGTQYDYAYSGVLDSNDNFYSTGYFAGTADFDPGAGTSNLTAVGSDDGYVSKLNSSGDFVWVKQLGGSDWEYPAAIDVDSDGNVYSTGYFGGTVDFDPGAGTSNLTAVDSDDIYISKLNSAGTFVWVKQIGGASSQYSYAIDLDASGNIYSGGKFSSTADFDPGAGVYNITASSFSNVYLSKLSPLTTPTLNAATSSLVTTNTATLNSNILNTGGDGNSERGFEYGLTNVYGSSVTESSGPYSTGAFTAQLTGLACGTIYYFRAFSTNLEDTGYSSGSSFITSDCSTSGSPSGGGGGSNTNTDTDAPVNESPIVPAEPISPANPNTTPNTENTPSNIGVAEFLKDLFLGSTGDDVRRLQIFLNSYGFKLASEGPGSPGNETDYYGIKTKSAVIIFQENYFEQILNPLGLTSGTGYFGPYTRSVVNKLLQNP